MKNKKQKKIIIKSDEIIEKLDEFFTLDEEDEVINLDEIINNESNISDMNIESIDEIDSNVPDKEEISETDQKKLDVESFIEDNVIDDDGIIESMDVFKSIYLAHPEINDNFIHFAMKFRYFLISENIHVNHITNKKIGKFLRLYPNMDIVMIGNFLKMPLN